MSNVSFKSVPNDEAVLTTYIRAVPKAELHLHIEGTLEPELMFSLARRNNIQLPYNDIDDARKAYNFSNLQSFLDLYYQGMSVLVHKQDFYDLAMAYFERAHQDNVVHVECFVDAPMHRDNGVDIGQLMDGLLEAKRDAMQQFNMSVEYILCFQRHQSQDVAIDMFRKAQPYFENKSFIGIGLDSSELGNPPQKFKSLYQMALEKNLHVVAHAGEEGGPDYVTAALDILNCARIDHGVRSIEDLDLVDRLVRDRVPLTCCPLSNVKLCVYADHSKSDVKKLLNLGVVVTLNSDDPAYFGGYIVDNYLAVFSSLQLSFEQIYALARNSFQASFLPQDKKESCLKKLREISASFM